MTHSKWILRNVKPVNPDHAKRLGVSPLLCKILTNRGIQEQEMDSFLHPSLENLHEPFLMKDMETGVNLVSESLLRGDKIRIAGDYDADGNAASVILVSGLQFLGAEVDYVIPHRIEEGYGLSNYIIDQALEDGISLLITCDNGISASGPVQYARDLGIKVVVTDHHQVPRSSSGEVIPNAHAVINPKQEGCRYPFRDLSGAGIAWKFIQAMHVRMGVGKHHSLDYLPFAALGTVCDVVSLTGENRILVTEGLHRIQHTANPGMMALLHTTGLTGKQITAYSLGFVLGPCINAAGRLQSAMHAVEMFLTSEYDLAENYARNLTQLNEERKLLTSEGCKLAFEAVETMKIETGDICLLFHPGIHESVAGIVAGRIRDRWHKPAVVLTCGREAGILKGSARSVEGIDIYEKLSQCAQLLLRYGGHSMAAGLSIKEENLNPFREMLNLKRVDPELLRHSVVIDAKLPVSDITVALIEELRMLEPCGRGNPKPLFAEKEFRVLGMQILGTNRTVLSLHLMDQSGVPVEGIYFGHAKSFLEYVDEKFGSEQVHLAMSGRENTIRLDLAFVPSIHEFRKEKTIRLVIEHFR